MTNKEFLRTLKKMTIKEIWEITDKGLLFLNVFLIVLVLFMIMLTIKVL